MKKKILLAMLMVSMLTFFSSCNQESEEEGGDAVGGQNDVILYDEKDTKDDEGEDTGEPSGDMVMEREQGQNESDSAPNAKSEPVAEPNKVEVAKSEPAKSEPVKSEKPKEDPNKPGTNKAEALKNEPVKNEATAEPPAAPPQKYKDGKFTGSAKGFVDNINVSVELKGDVIKSISIVSHKEDEPYISDAKGVIAKMLKAQSADVDAVAGATFSSDGIKNAVKAALASAKN